MASRGKVKKKISKFFYWKKSNVDFYDLHINGKSYFESLYQSILLAQDQICILGWDIDFRIQLIEREDKSLQPYQDKRCLGGLLSYVAHKNKDLKIYLLIWNHPFFYSSDSELFSQVKAKYWLPNNVYFLRDDVHPISGCHHEKLVVVDQKVAYVGGIDLTSGRWDEFGNPAESFGREDVSIGSYLPFRDFMLQISGDASVYLARYFGHRWKRCALNRDPVYKSKPYFSQEKKHQNLTFYIARSRPRYRLYPKVKEGIKLHLELIKRAKNFIYIENQYLTNNKIVSSLIRQCKKNPKLQVTIVLPLVLQGALEKRSMQRKFRKIIRDLKREDRKLDNLCLFYPIRTKDDGSVIPVYVHSKMMIVDDFYLKVGSSNLNERSMGLDTELDVVVEFEKQNGVSDLKNKILSSLLQVDELEIKKELLEYGHINALLTLKYLNVSIKKFVIDGEPGETFLDKIIRSLSLDQNRPHEMEELLEELFKHSQLTWIKKVFVNIFFLIVLSAITYVIVFYSRFLMSYFPFSEQILTYLNFHDLNWIFGLGVFVLYILLGSVFFPLNVFILINATVFPPIAAFVFSFLGALLVSIFGFWYGKRFGLSYIRKHFPLRTKKILGFVKKKGVLPVFLLRLIPLLPYPMTNFLLGAINYDFFHYFKATALGVIPGIIVFVVLQRTLLDLIIFPDSNRFILFIVIIFFVLIFFKKIKKRFL